MFGKRALPASGIGPAACSTARSATTCVASRRVAAAYGVAHLALRTPFYVQNHDARSASTVVTRLGRYVAAHHGRVTTVDALRAWEHWSTGVVLFRSRPPPFGCTWGCGCCADAPSPLSTPRSAAGQAQLRLGQPLCIALGQAPMLSGTQEEESQGVLGLSGLRSLFHGEHAY